MTIFKNYCDELDYVKFVMIDLERFPTIQEDRRKHTAHDAVCAEIKKNFQVLGYAGDLNNRQEMAKFACIYEGRKDLVDYAN